MTIERLSELQNMALAGKKPEVLDEEEAAAWTWINERVQAYKKQNNESFERSTKY